MTIEEMLAIKEARGYSFAMLSKYSGVPQGTIQKIFIGATRNPRKATLDALERVLTGDESVYSGKAFSYDAKGNEELLLKEAATAYGSAWQPGSTAEKLSEDQPKREKKPGEYTLEDYYALPDERRVELIDGVIYDMNSPKTVHQAIIGNVYVPIAEAIRKKKGPCRVFLSPVDVQLDCDNRTMVEPDLIIVCDPKKIRGFGIYGAPDFVLEVLSESTRRKDMFLKLAKYESAGVREYWLIDPKKKKLLIYNFMEEESFPQTLDLKGEVGLAIYGGEVRIDLDRLAEEIDEINRLSGEK